VNDFTGHSTPSPRVPAAVALRLFPFYHRVILLHEFHTHTVVCLMETGCVICKI